MKFENLKSRIKNGRGSIIGWIMAMVVICAMLVWIAYINDVFFPF